MDFARQLGITLIQIPFWWDKTKTSLVATIRALRPDLILEGSTYNSISSTIPLQMMQQFKYLANTAIPYSKRMNTTGWYVAYILLINSFRLMMEKYDGVRVYWDGSRLHSKHPSVVLDIPKRLNFPNIPFEGELWYLILIRNLIKSLGWDQISTTSASTFWLLK
jgi:hypothetical protein